MRDRAALRCDYFLEEDEIKTAAIAISAVAEEFRRDWDEMVTVLPGGLDLYGRRFDDAVFMALIARIQESHSSRGA
jgi:hypothetical protein